MFADNDNHHGTNCGVTSVILAPVIIMFGVTYLLTYSILTCFIVIRGRRHCEFPLMASYMKTVYK